MCEFFFTCILARTIFDHYFQLNMAPRKVVSFLAGSVRLLQKRVEVLEGSLRPFALNPEAPVFKPKTTLRLESLVPPPGIFSPPLADVQLADLVNELLKNDCDNKAATPTTSLQLPFSDDDLNDALQRAQAVLHEFVPPRGVFSRGSEETSFEYWKFPEENFVRDSVQLAFGYSKWPEENYVDFSDCDSDLLPEVPSLTGEEDMDFEESEYDDDDPPWISIEQGGQRWRGVGPLVPDAYKRLPVL